MEGVIRERSIADRAWLIAPVLFYLLIAIPAGVGTRERFNSDGVCYLHRAILLTQGKFYDSISAYWSPGLSWSVLPFLFLGADPLHAIHLTLLLWGSAFVVAAQLFLHSLLPAETQRTNRWILAAGAAIALTAVRLSTPVITPDVVLGALLLLYLYLVPNRPGVAGVVAGVAYLGKAYALPFFLVHFLMTVIVRRLGWRPALLGYLGFALVAGPWVGVLSWKYGRFTFSTAATRNRFMQDVAPPDVRAHPPDVSRVPPDPFLTNMEITDADAWPRWSPLDNANHFAHQVHIAVEHLRDLLGDAWRFDYVGFALIAVALALGLRTRESSWLWLTGCIYASGLLLVVYETRYALPVLPPIALGLCFLMCERWEPRVMPFIIAACFGLAAAGGCYSALRAIHPNVTDRQIAKSIVDAKLTGLFATNTANRDRASCVAFFLDQKFIALPQDTSAITLQEKLDADGVRFFYRWFDPNYAESKEWPEPQARLLLLDGEWKKKRSIHLDSRRRLDIYERVMRAGQPGTTLPIARR